MADQFDKRVDEWMQRIFALEDSGDPKHPVRGCIDYGAKADVEKEIAAALRTEREKGRAEAVLDTDLAELLNRVRITAESGGFARGVREAANLCVYRHRDGSVCLDRDYCTADVVHSYYEPKALEKMIRALIPTDTAKSVANSRDEAAAVIEAVIAQARITVEDVDHLCLKHQVGAMAEDVDCIACFEAERLDATVDACAIEVERLEVRSADAERRFGLARDALEVLINSLGDVADLGRFARSVDPIKLVSEWREHLRDLLARLGAPVESPVLAHIAALEQKFADDGDVLYAFRLLREQLGAPSPSLLDDPVGQRLAELGAPSTPSPVEGSWDWAIQTGKRVRLSDWHPSFYRYVEEGTGFITGYPNGELNVEWFTRTDWRIADPEKL